MAGARLHTQNFPIAVAMGANARSLSSSSERSKARARRIANSAGKPAFAPGEELKLADSMLKGGVQTGVGGPAKVVVGGDAAKTGGVVKLSLDDTMDDF